MSDATSANLSSMFVGLGLAFSVPVVDGDAIFGALLGAWLVVSTRGALKVWQRIGSLLLSAGVGYLFTPLVLLTAPFLSNGVAAFIGSVVVIPICIKVMIWLDSADLKDILQRLRG
ncbi:putative holin [Pseudomonas rubra]|uniref:Phage holin family protein n=1 Tax=Pseudomonas rubra TaxID=2942627 RepID=A0ABT5P1I7_9PSED|nr:putative holin [Pseudomonas rubra]MDD1012133.1 phage holin family protein [Pseudomonas rubra]MDD1038431.1 phage holin family protein [Pseudomonas rubra]MDD1153468.1 phage holin family protein [Pseudomonas rubra]